MLTRRRFNLGLAAGLVCCASISACTKPSPATGPQAWRARRGKADVTLFGFGDARDWSWQTPRIKSAFEASSELWLETAGSNAQPKSDEAYESRIRALSELSNGSLFDVLEPHVRQPLRDRMAQLEVAEGSVQSLRPWRAFYVINGAYWRRNTPGYEPVLVDRELERAAQESGKRISYEFPNYEKFAKFMASMPDQAQSQYIEWLLGFLDDQDRGLNDDTTNFGWIKGVPPTRTLDRMIALKQLTIEMHWKRNRWWADKIDDLLAQGAQAFVAVGQLHVLGPAAIPTLLKDKDVELETLR